MKFKIETALRAVAIAACAAMAAPSQAEIYTVTFSGTVGGFCGYGCFTKDTYGTFGSSADLNGARLAVQFFVDTSKGVYGSQPGYAYLYGAGPINGVGPISASVKVGAVTVAFPATFAAGFSQDYGSSGIHGSDRQTTYSVGIYGTANYVSLSFDVPQAPFFEGALAHPFTYTPTNTSSGIVRIGSDGTATPRADVVFGVNLDSLIVAGVPDVTSWTAMTIGFGLLGLTLRRRRRSLATA